MNLTEGIFCYQSACKFCIVVELTTGVVENDKGTGCRARNDSQGKHEASGANSRHAGTKEGRCNHIGAEKKIYLCWFFTPR
jgi:hypothetical protein